MSHETWTGFDDKFGRGEFVAKTAGFKSDKAAITNRLSKKNLKNTKVKFFTGPDRIKKAKEFAKYLSSLSEKVKQENSRKSGYYGGK